jgi:predicted N-acetyltransferase YhbS
MPAAALPSEAIRILPEEPGDAALVEGLIARAFGPGRFAKAAERLREGRTPARDLSFVAWSGRTAVGAVRLWPVRVGDRKALLLGPIAVEAARRREGLGAELVRDALAAAEAAGWELIVLVGDAPFFGPLGFSDVPARALRMPGPVDQRRVLVRALRAGADDDLAGDVAPLA